MSPEQPIMLVVEDESEVRDLARDVLAESGFRVFAAPNGDVALTILQAVQPDVLFADIVMPGDLDGLQLADVARSHHPGIKVVATTGYSSAQAAAPRKCDRMLVKPYRPSELLKEIGEALAA